MALRDILIWPDPRLMKLSKPVELNADGSVPDDIKTLVKDMFDTMYEADGVGLAAPQVGVLKRVVVVDIRAYDKDKDGDDKADKNAKAGSDPARSGEAPIALINPVFSDKSGKLEWDEGCLSVPGESGLVTRAAKCRVDYIDLDGKPASIEAEGLKSVALQHECDHLDGRLYIEGLEPDVKREAMRLIRQAPWFKVP